MEGKVFVDFIAELNKRGVLVIIAEEILKYLDFESLSDAAKVSNLWNKVILNSRNRSSLMEKCTKRTVSANWRMGRYSKLYVECRSPDKFKMNSKYIVVQRQNCFEMFNRKTMHSQRKIQLNESFNDSRFRLSENLLVSSNRLGKPVINVWDVETGEKIHVLTDKGTGKMLTFRISCSEKYLVSATQIDVHKRETLLTLRKFTNKKEVNITFQMHSNAFLYPLSVDDCYIVYMIGIPASPCKVEIRLTETFELLHCITDEYYRLFRYFGGLIITQTFTSPTIKIWNVASWKCVGEFLPAEDGAVEKIRFIEKTNYVISVESNRRINDQQDKTAKLFKVWDIIQIIKRGLNDRIHEDESLFLWSTEISETSKRLIGDEYKIFLFDTQNRGLVLDFLRKNQS